MNKSNLQTYDEPIELGKSLDGHRSHRAFRISDEYVAKLGVGKETVSNQKLLDYNLKNFLKLLNSNKNHQ